MEALARLQKKVAGKADLLLIASESNIRYVTGVSEVSGVVVIPAHQDPFILTSVMEKPRLANVGMEVLSVGKTGDIQKKKTLLALKEELERRKIRHSTVAVEKKQISASLWEKASRMTKRTVDFTDELARMRMIKQPEEIRNVKVAASIGDAGIRAARESIRAGMTEHELARQIEYEMRRRADWFSFMTIVGSGPNSAIPHHTISDRKIRKDDLVVVDIGAIYKGYCSDITRTMCLKPGPRERSIHAAVLTAQKLAISRAMPGAAAKSVDLAARSFLKKANYVVPHSIGHGIGIDIHELPSISPDSKDVLRPGMVFTVEPGAYIEGYGGVRIEDMILLTHKGRIILTKSPRCL